VSVEVSNETQAGDTGWDRGPNLVGALWRYRWAVLLFSCLTATVGYVYAAAQPPAFEAVGQVAFFGPHERSLFRPEGGAPAAEIQRYLDTQADRMKSPDVLARASELVGGRLRPGQIRQIVHAESSTKILEVTVRARHDDATQAAEVVNAVTQAYQDVTVARLQDQVNASVAQLGELEADLRRRLAALSGTSSDPRVQEERNRLSAELGNLQTKAGQIRADAAVQGAGVERVDHASAPEQPVSDSPRRNAVIFGLLGFIAALIGAFWRSERVQVVESSRDAAAALDAPPLGTLASPASGTATAAAAVVMTPRSVAGREHQLIASRLTLIARESEPRAIPVTSPAEIVLVASPGKTVGKSVTALNLALAAAQDQRSVILIDLDNAGAMTNLLGAGDQQGVSNLLACSDESDAAVADYVATVDELPRVDGFRFIPLGTAASDDRDVSAAPQLQKLLARLQQEADLIILDGPPLLLAPAAMKLTVIVDGIVLVVARGSALEDLRQTWGLLEMARAPVIGYVFDRSRPPRAWRFWRKKWPSLRRSDSRA
jgi:polysaccharide biosynthesis transport protein